MKGLRILGIVILVAVLYFVFTVAVNPMAANQPLTPLMSNTASTAAPPNPPAMDSITTFADINEEDDYFCYLPLVMLNGKPPFPLPTTTLCRLTSGKSTCT